MSEEKKLIPELRFPEFDGDGEWVEDKFGKVYRFLVTNSFSRALLNFEDGEVKNIHYGDIHTKFSTLFDISQEDVPYINPDVSIERIREECYCQEGDMIFADASEDLNDIGKSIEIVNLNGELLVSGLHTLMARQIKKTLEIGFGGYLFKSDWIRKQIQREAQGAKVLGISSGRISNIKIFFPRNSQEQQKIAACLSSLDELIAAHTDKLNAINDHKKGLMQYLFPQEGETGPKVRFPEFEGDGEWEEKPLEEVSKITTGNKDTQDKIDDGKYPFFVRSQTIERINSYSYDGEAILTSGDGVGVGKIYHYIIGKFDFHQRVYCIYDFDRNVEGKFIFYFFSEHFYQRVMKLSAKNSVDSVRRAMITEMPISFPPTIQEQQKIASCLSAVDELITAQQEKINQLQQHKKGLMQGLFPNPSAISN